jgi:hypothetical protein
MGTLSTVSRRWPTHLVSTLNGSGSSNATAALSGKAYPDDGFELDDRRVFVDFWRRFGPRYPDDVTLSVARIRPAPGWINRLPVGDAEL